MMDKTVPLAPTSLVYAFAHKWVPSPGALTSGTRCPCNDIKVNTELLANLLLACSFWSLREQRVIDLSPMVHRTRVLSTIHVDVTRLAEYSHPGLEGAIARNVDGPDGKDELADVVCRAFGCSENPWRTVIEETATAAVDCNELQTIESQVEVLASSWNAFRSNEPELYDALTARCAKAIRLCRDIYFP